jgi:NADH-quinone oxidoreductase subunit N
MYMREPEADPAPIERSPFTVLALVLSVSGVMLLGLFPDPIITFLRASAASLL